MLTKLLYLFVLVSLLTIFTSSVAIAASGSNCPPGFSPEEVMDHEHHHHQHVGTSADQNGDGQVCMKHVTPDESIHVHVDNHLP